MNYTLCTTFPNPLLFKSDEPCLSLYMPTSKVSTNQKQDILVFKNLVKKAKLSLEQKYADKTIKPLMTLLNKMTGDNELWQHASAGLALFATLDDMIVYRLEQSFKPISIVANSFHIKPLIQHFQGLDTYLLLALDAESFALYEGNHVDIKPITLGDDIATTLTAALGTQHTEAYQTHGVYGGAADGSTFHGHGGKSDDVDIDREKFFRHVDRVVLDYTSIQTKKPLILVSHKAYQHDFKSVSRQPWMLDVAIDGAYHDFSMADIKHELKKINQQRMMVQVDQALKQYHDLRSKDLSTDQIILVLKGLLAARVDTLFIEEDKIIPGKIDIENQQIIQNDLTDPETDDLLDDMVQHAMQTGSKVWIIPQDQMPSSSGVAAIFRY